VSRVNGKRLLVTGLALLLCIVGSFPGTGLAAVDIAKTVSFSDIKGHWAEKEILEMAQQGVVHGFPDGTFHPEEEVSEEQFMALLHRMLPAFTGHESEEYELKAYMAKVKGRWSEPIYRSMFIAGIIGYQQPTEGLTRFAAARLMLAGLAAQSEGEKYRYTKAKFFRDVPLEESEVIVIYPIYKLGVMTGFPDGTFRSREKVTRAQAVLLMKRFREKMNELYPDNLDAETKKRIVSTARSVLGQLEGNEEITDFAKLTQYVREKKLPVTTAFLEEHFSYLKRTDGVDYVGNPKFDELLYISRIWENKYRITAQYYAGELGGSIDRTFYLSSQDGKSFTLIGKNE
jgi:hypothetical protein